MVVVIQNFKTGFRNGFHFAVLRGQYPFAASVSELKILLSVQPSIRKTRTK